MISAQGFNMDREKISVVTNWPTPKTIKQIRGFLGLAGYNRKFIRGFASIAASLIDLLKNYAYVWDDLASRGCIQQALGGLNKCSSAGFT